MQVKGYEITLVIFGIFLISSFVPIFQIWLGHLNGMILYFIESIINVRAFDLAIPANLILSIVCLFAYLKSKKQFSKILTASLASFFIGSLGLFIFETFIIYTEIYWLQFFAGALLIGLSLFTIDTIRIKTKNE